MKTYTIIIALLLMGSSLFAQDRKITFGLRAGVNFQNLTGKSTTGTDLENDLLTGFHGGINAELPVGTDFYLQPGVLYSLKGAEFPSGGKVKISYVEIPVNLVYKPMLGKGSMLLGFGPYVAFGIGGKVEASNGTETDIVFNNEYDLTEMAPQYRGMDAGANILAGYEFSNKFSFQLNAQLGLLNIAPESNVSGDKSKLNNTGWGLSLGYRF